MKILITESQRHLMIQDYLDNIINSPEYSFIDNINIVKGTTMKGGWSREYSVPYYEYNIYLKNNITKEERELLSELKEKIITTHRIVFPQKEGGSPSAYYSIDVIE